MCIRDSSIAVDNDDVIHIIIAFSLDSTMNINISNYCVNKKMAAETAPISSSSNVSQWRRDSNGRPLVLVLLGKSGVGKSTLINNFLDLKKEERCETGDGASTTSLEVVTKEKVKEDIIVQAIDTPGLEGVGKISSRKVVKDVAKEPTANNGVDVVLYCISIHPASHIDSSDVKIIDLLTSTFGSEIWRHTILCLTFANLRQPKNDDNYKLLIESYAQQFEKALWQANVFDVQVRSIFSTTPEIAQSKKTIPAIPVGLDPKKSLPLNSNWSDQLFNELLKQSNPKSAAPQLLEPVGILLPAAELGGSITTGTALGAAIGTAIGFPIFGIGAIPGVAVGALIGGVVGAMLPMTTTKVRNKYLSWKAKKMNLQRTS